MTNMAGGKGAADTSGLVVRAPTRYDVIVWLMTMGRERALRERIVRLARLVPGESVLDVGCGTGSVAIAAKRCVGLTGSVNGIDASPEMLSRAAKKAARAGLKIEFQQAFAQSLPFPDARFDAVLSTVMFHHLPRPARQRCAAEMRRVVKPNGRVLVVDFDGKHDNRGLLARMHRHGHVRPQDLAATLSDAGMTNLASGAVGFRDLHFILARP